MVLVSKKKKKLYGGSYNEINPEVVKEKNCTVIENIPKPEISKPSNIPQPENTINNKKVSDEKLKRFIVLKNFKLN